MKIKLPAFIKNYWYLFVIGLVLLSISITIFIILKNRHEANNINLIEDNPLEVKIDEQSSQQYTESKINQEIKKNNAGLADTSEEIISATAYSNTDIQQHNTIYNCWLFFDDPINGAEIYDISNWEYPGQSDITPACGKTDNTALDIFLKDKQDKPPVNLFKGTTF